MHCGGGEALWSCCCCVSLCSSLAQLSPPNAAATCRGVVAPQMSAVIPSQSMGADTCKEAIA